MSLITELDLLAKLSRY